MRGSLQHYKGDRYKYTVVVGYKIADGKRKAIRKTTMFTAEGKSNKQRKEDLERKCMEFLKTIDSDDFEGGIKTLGDYLDRYLKDGSKRWKPSGYEFYKTYIIYRIKPNLGEYKIADITTRMIDKFLEGQTDGKFSKRHCYQVLHAVWRQMILDGDCSVTTNLLDRVKPPSIPKANNPVWTIDHIKLFLNASRHYRYHLVFYLAIVTGCRINEILALNWHDINFDDRYIVVNKNVLKSGLKPLLGTPKTNTSIRRITISQETIDRLLQHKQQQEWEIKHRVSVGKWVGCQQLEGMVFTTIDGRVINNDYLSKREFHPTITRLQANPETWVPRITVRDLRHSTATYLLDIGTPLEIVSDILGHSTTDITRKYYVKININRQTNYINHMSSEIVHQTNTKHLETTNQTHKTPGISLDVANSWPGK